jgi:glycosyltransferase involved in cell wall biosynthesis
MEKPLISIIIPVYKVEKYLEKCIKSVLDQTYKNLQIILVDDGSPDNCGKICDNYVKIDNRIEVIHKENGGLSDARNVGLKKARGKYIGFVDSDDYVSNGMFENMYNTLVNNNADVSICNFYTVIDNKNIIKNVDNGIEIYNKLEILKEILLDKKIQSYAWNKLYKRELFKDIEYPVGKKYEDIGTTFYILEKCNKIAVSGSPEYYYITRGDSIVNNNTEGTVIDYISLISDRYDYIDKKYKELKKYNDYYITKTLITAYTDAYHLKNNSEEFLKILNNFFNKVKNIFKNNEEDIITLFNDEQKMQLDMLLKDKKVFYKLLEEKNDVK